MAGRPDPLGGARGADQHGKGTAARALPRGPEIRRGRASSVPVGPEAGGHADLAQPAAAHRRVDSGIGGDGAQLRSEEHTSELQSLMRISYAVFCLKKKSKTQR